MPNLSNRGNDAPSSPIRKLASFAEQAKMAGKQIFHLNIGQPDIPSPKEALEAIKQDESDVVEYGPTQGKPSLRRIYANYYRKFEAYLETEDVFVTTGASEAILFAMAACCNPGDEIIIPEPFYANYTGFANFCSAKIVPIPSYLEEGFNLPEIGHFKNKITDQTKAILLCNPGNPTGKVYSREDLIAILDLVMEHDLFLIVDEVYKEFCYDKKFISVLEFEQAKEHVIVVDSVSKIYSLCGARIGFLSTRNKAIQSAVLKFAQMRLCPPHHGQQLAEVSFQYRYPYIDEVKGEYRLRRDTLYAELQKIENISIYLPEGAFYIIAGLPVDDAETFCQWLLSDFSYKNKTVMFSPAAGFYHDESLGKNQIRIAFVLNPAAIREAMECLREGLKVYNKALVSTSQGA